MRFSIFLVYAVLNIPYMRLLIFPTCGSQYSLYVGFQYSLYVGFQYSLYVGSQYSLCGSQYSLYAVLNIPYIRFSIFLVFLVCGFSIFLVCRFSIFPICGSHYWPFHWTFQSIFIINSFI